MYRLGEKNKTELLSPYSFASSFFKPLWILLGKDLPVIEDVQGDKYSISPESFVCIQPDLRKAEVTCYSIRNFYSGELDLEWLKWPHLIRVDENCDACNLKIKEKSTKNEKNIFELKGSSVLIYQFYHQLKEDNKSGFSLKQIENYYAVEWNIFLYKKIANEADPKVNIWNRIYWKKLSYILVQFEKHNRIIYDEYSKTKQEQGGVDKEGDYEKLKSQLYDPHNEDVTKKEINKRLLRLNVVLRGLFSITGGHSKLWITLAKITLTTVTFSAITGWTSSNSYLVKLVALIIRTFFKLGIVSNVHEYLTSSKVLILLNKIVSEKWKSLMPFSSSLNTVPLSLKTPTSSNSQPNPSPNPLPPQQQENLQQKFTQQQEQLQQQFIQFQEQYKQQIQQQYQQHVGGLMEQLKNQLLDQQKKYQEQERYLQEQLSKQEIEKGGIMEQFIKYKTNQENEFRKLMEDYQKAWAIETQNWQNTQNQMKDHVKKLTMDKQKLEKELNELETQQKGQIDQQKYNELFQQQQQQLQLQLNIKKQELEQISKMVEEQRKLHEQQSDFQDISKQKLIEQFYQHQTIQQESFAQKHMRKENPEMDVEEQNKKRRSTDTSKSNKRTSTQTPPEEIIQLVSNPPPPDILEQLRSYAFLYNSKDPFENLNLSEFLSLNETGCETYLIPNLQQEKENKNKMANIEGHFLFKNTKNDVFILTIYNTLIPGQGSEKKFLIHRIDANLADSYLTMAKEPNENYYFLFVFKPLHFFSKRNCVYDKSDINFSSEINSIVQLFKSTPLIMRKERESIDINYRLLNNENKIEMDVKVYSGFQEVIEKYHFEISNNQQIMTREIGNVNVVTDKITQKDIFLIFKAFVFMIKFYSGKYYKPNFFMTTKADTIIPYHGFGRY